MESQNIPAEIASNPIPRGRSFAAVSVFLSLAGVRTDILTPMHSIGVRNRQTSDRVPSRRGSSLKTNAMQSKKRSRFSAIQVSALCSLLGGLADAATLDLKNAVVLAPPESSARERKAVQMLTEEIEKRSRVLLPVLPSWPSSNTPVIAVGNQSALRQFAGPYAKEMLEAPKASGPEGYRISIKRGAASSAVFAVGNDERGVLFGIGRLLRELHMQRGSLSIEDNLQITTMPKYPLRGHQLGYRPKTHAYDAWDLPVWEQYYRDLAVFGCNAIELIPPRSDDASDSPHFPRLPMEMMIGMSRLADNYGLDVWVWYPAMDRDYSDPQTVEYALREWGEVFSKLPRIDAVFVPGGDPGHTQPKYLMALLEKQTESLHRYHPKAQMWVSPQGFTQEWWDEFIKIVQEQKLKWLTGVVFGPQVRLDTVKLRKLVPDRFKLRHYPDITHNRQCQFPVADWDTAFALTEARECVNPRPRAYANIFRRFQPPTCGFIAYSEGCNDDVNKILWLELGWDPDRDVTEILRDYGRYFIGEAQADEFTQGLLGLEENWRGPALVNAGIERTWERFQALERAGGPKLRANWRFQMAIFRAACDAYVKQRLAYETELERLATDALARAPETGSLAAMDTAQATLYRAATNRELAELREQVSVWGEALFQSVRMQLSVRRHRAIARDRGATLDTIDYPLNNRLWLMKQFREIRALEDEAARRARLRSIVQWTDPGPGGFYDNLGDVTHQSHLVRPPDPATDPSNLDSAYVGFADPKWGNESLDTLENPWRYSWADQAETLRYTPLRLHYEQVDPTANYRVRLVYGGDSPQKPIRLVANDGIEIHPPMPKPQPVRPVEFPIPHDATVSGQLTLSWTGDGALGGNGRGCQVSEVWLLKDAKP